jgi:glucose-1-phosphatase
VIKSIVFDLGRVLIPFDFTNGYNGISALTGLPHDEIRARLKQDGLVVRFETGLMGAHDFVSAVSKLLEADIPYEQFCEIWSSIFLPETLFPESFIEALHANCRLVLLSNTNVIHFTMIRERYPILRHFDSYVLSYEVRAMKPSAEIYAAAVREARCLPGECFFTDDIEDYVTGARQYGIDAVQFESCEQIQRELRSRGVRW